MSEKLPEIAHLRGLGNPMFFTFNVEPKSKILICHAAIMGTFILPPDAQLNLCTQKDDPRLPHFVKYLVANRIGKHAAALRELQDIGEEIWKDKPGLVDLKERLKQKLEEVEKLIKSNE